jgi:hypothetical protein
MLHVCASGEAYTGFWWGNLRDKDHLEDPGLNGKNNIEMDLEVGFRGMDWMDQDMDR